MLHAEAKAKALHRKAKREKRSMKRFCGLHAYGVSSAKDMKRFAALPQSMKRRLRAMKRSLAASCFFAFLPSAKMQKKEQMIRGLSKFA